jgi:hypothetical protein
VKRTQKCVNLDVRVHDGPAKIAVFPLSFYPIIEPGCVLGLEFNFASEGVRT